MLTNEKSRIFWNDKPGFEIGSIALSPDRQQLVFSFYFYEPVSLQTILHSGLQIMRTDGKGLWTLVETSEPDWAIGAPRWSPDGTQVAYLREYLPPGGYSPHVRLHVLNVGTGHDRVVTEDGGLFSWSPGGDRIVFSGKNDSGIYVFDLDNCRLEALWEDERLTFGSPAWQPDGESIAVPVLDSTVRSSSKGLYAVSVASGQRRKVTDDTPVSVQWSPDGEKLVFSAIGTGGNQTWMVDVEDGSSAKLLDRTATLGDPTWSDDGSALLLAVEEAPERSYWITVMAVADHSLARLALANTMLPFSTW